MTPAFQIFISPEAPSTPRLARAIVPRLSGGVDRVPRAYVECTGYEGSVMGPFAARAQSEGWFYRALATEHDLHLFDPEGTASVLDSLSHG